ncbi:MAG TPA: hypothetical protein VMV61_08910 [Patescibacteria group bacterium]|nr:hypothetical protein [Patescibacteria group bacterium]
MNIIIEEGPFSLGSYYTITTPAAIYSAKKPFSIRDNVYIYGPGGKILVSIKGHILSFPKKYDFAFADGRVCRFRAEKLWKPVYVCQDGGEFYRLYQHKGLKYSIFLRERQIAAFTKNRFQLGKGQQFELRVENDVDLLLVISMVLTIGDSEDEGNSAFTINIGNIGPEERAYDNSWEPS